MDAFCNNICEYGFAEEDRSIKIKRDLDKAGTRKWIRKFKKNIIANAENNEKTLTVVYYAGHGMMKDN